LLRSQSLAFLSDYERVRGEPFTAEERQIAWTSGLWVDCYNAAAEVLTCRPGQAHAVLIAEHTTRARLAGL